MPARAFSASRPTSGMQGKWRSRSDRPGTDGRFTDDCTVFSGEGRVRSPCPFTHTKLSEKNRRQQTRAISSIDHGPSPGDRGERRESIVDVTGSPAARDLHKCRTRILHIHFCCLASGCTSARLCVSSEMKHVRFERRCASDP